MTNPAEKLPSEITFFTGDDKTLPSQHQAPKSVFEWRNYVDTFTMLADNKWILKYKCSPQIHYCDKGPDAAEKDVEIVHITAGYSTPS